MRNGVAIQTSNYDRDNVKLKTIVQNSKRKRRCEKVQKSEKKRKKMQKMVKKEGSFEFLVFSFELWNPDTSMILSAGKSGWDF